MVVDNLFESSGDWHGRGDTRGRLKTDWEAEVGRIFEVVVVVLLSRFVVVPLPHKSVFGRTSPRPGEERFWERSNKGIVHAAPTASLIKKFLFPFMSARCLSSASGAAPNYL